MIPINRISGCGISTSGTGMRACNIADFGDPNGFNLHPKGFSQNIQTDTLSDTSWKNLMKGFKVKPFTDIYDFGQSTPENERSTSSRGIKRKIRSGIPEFSFMFTKGGCFHKKLYDHIGDNKWDISIMFDTGILFATNVAGTEISGFDMGMFDVETFKLQQGTDPQMSTAVIQLIGALQFNKYWTFITWEELGYNFSKIEGVVDAKISYTTVPTASTTFAVKVSDSCNENDVILGFESASDWRLGGTQVSTTSISTVVYRPATKDYLFTVSPALVSGDTVQPTLVSVSYDVAVDDDGALYKGQAPLATVA